MPHSKPSTTSRASSLKRLSCAIVVSWMRVPSRKMRTFALRRTTPLVTMQPAIVPRRETWKSARTSTSPITASVSTGESMPTSACSISLGQLVDHAVLADLDPLALGELARLGRRPHVEADHHRVRGGGEVDVVLGDAADAGVDHVDAHLGVLDLRELADDRLDRALHVALEDDVQVLDAAGLHLLEQVLERDAAAGCFASCLAAQALAALVRELAGAAVVLDDARELAGVRRLVEAEDLDRVARACACSIRSPR